MKIVRRLLEAPQSVNDLSDSLGISQYNISKHLRILREAGLVHSEKKGQQRIYALEEAFHNQLQEGSQVLDLGCCSFDFNKLP